MDIEELVKNPTEFEEKINKLLREKDPSIKEIIKMAYPLADKKGKKFLKKVVHILRTRGMEVEIPEENREPVFKPLQTVKKLLCASFDGNGIMPLAFSVEKGDFSVSVLAMHYRNGIVEIIVDERGLKNDPLPALKNEWEKTGFFVYEIPYEHGLYHLKKALSRGRKILPSFISFEELKNLNYEPIKEIPITPSSTTRGMEEILFEIHRFLPFAVLLSKDEISKYLEEYENVVLSPIILTSWTKQEREMEILKRIIKEVVENKKDAYGDFFIECGIIAMKKGLFESAGVLKGWALELMDESIPSEEKPVLQSIVRASLEFWRNQKECGIIKP